MRAHALLDLKTVFPVFTVRANSPHDAVNMQPPLAFRRSPVRTWIVMALGILAVTMRLYVVGKKKHLQLDQPFDPIPLFPPQSAKVKPAVTVTGNRQPRGQAAFLTTS